MRLVRRVSLRARLTAIATVGSLVVFAAGALLLYQDLTREIDSAITAELSVRVSDLETELGGGPGARTSSHVVAQAVRPDGTVLEPAGSRPLLTSAERARADRGTVLIDRKVPGIGDHARLLARPLRQGATGRVVIGVAAASTGPLEVARDRLASVLFAAGPLVGLGVALASWFLAGAAMAPVRRMAREASTISLTDRARRLPQPAGGDEFAELGTTLNAMLDRIEATIQHERAFIDDAAHELRTPVAVLRGELELASLDVGDRDAVLVGLASAIEEADRLTRLTTNLLTLARSDAGELVAAAETVDLVAFSRDLVAHLPATLIDVGVMGRPVTARVDEGWLAQILTNLLSNAVRHAATTVRVVVRDRGDRVELLVADDGPGFAPAILPHAFDRFARADDARGRVTGGTGLGLAITASLTTALHGTVRASNGPPLGGACLTIELPRS